VSVLAQVVRDGHGDDREAVLLVEPAAHDAQREPRRKYDSAVAEHVEVTLRQIDPDDAVREGEVLDRVERAPKLEHPGR
jgi:hypothetical protein